MVGKKGKSSNDKSVKSHKLSLTKFSGGSTKKKSKNKNMTQRVDNQKTRNKDDFAQQLNELRERSLGISKAATAGRKTEKPTLKIREATFQLPSASPADSAPVNSFADQYLEGERSQVVPVVNKASKAAKVTTYNRFELLENDELLEDGSHSILVMDVKPATFSLQSRETTF
eukprot:CAMPEP_0184973176 /NCGR_PEP_ID=MMETSP1098-20130426/5068_1 /TAXON_ID=89044 /ORGANISM="Spumella elongata, Strain CCAP 955/1" /LENGTH=171 /DNA_ID=CAMNT_0027495615 /DNA_START=41 /DNA_END=556 /DNA_ORIENTATION=+